ncbi:MAG: thiol:disulfide interchange protein DsbA/DsbL [Pseudomonadales bacterium]|nr:thiol:disulfide interchange protein DsbA/DsbL [Pseudomonadales bacterium]MCP5186053.1 thiol:disulfide interchange protein DsbA/DsbL [Pseudomonadales bacterium]
MSSKEHAPANIIRLRHGIIAFVLIVVAAVAIYGLLYSTGATVGEITEGEHYTVLDPSVAHTPGEPVEVMEFFSYACVHCYQFDPLIEDWRGRQTDAVRFKRQPVDFSPAWATLAQAYLTFEAMDILDDNHERLFRALHDQGKVFNTVEALADFVDGHGATRDEFLATFNSPTIRRATARLQDTQRKFQVSGVPTLVVGGKYLVKMEVGRKLSLAVVDHLVKLEQADKPVVSAPSDGN